MLNIRRCRYSDAKTGAASPMQGWQQSVQEIVCFAPENTRSASEDIAGIEKMSIAIEDKIGNLDR